MVILHDYRKTFLKQHDGKAHQDSQNIISYFEALNSLGFPGSKPALKDSALASLQLANADILKSMSDLFPKLNLKNPKINAPTALPFSWETDGNVSQILAQIDPVVVALTRKLISLLLGSVARADIDKIDRRNSCCLREEPA